MREPSRSENVADAGCNDYATRERTIKASGCPYAEIIRLQRAIAGPALSRAG